ncbi:metallopeptidase family protein [Haloglycomyces albus]|uniref:metallopeptidase family protein n=1 Tax=Haloglycomyces albus TaxID=526067 RepID=UPI00046C9518|nr:metallopeptidase family protein [Haloglycomyces albus]
MTAEEFEEAVGDALDSIPQRLMGLLDNVVILVEDEPPPGEPGLLGLYEGIALTERGSDYGAVLPDTITIFRGPHMSAVSDREAMIAEIRTTVVHEIAHHFGIDDAHLHELGWG